MSIYKKYQGRDPYSIFLKNSSSHRDLFDFSLERFHERYPNLKNGYKPKVKLNEYDSHYLISFRVPGLKEDDIKIDINENQIKLSTDSVTKGYSKTLLLKHPINIKTVKAYSVSDTYKIIAIKK